MPRVYREWIIRADTNLPLAVVEIGPGGKVSPWCYECDHAGAVQADAQPWQLALAQLLVALPANAERHTLADRLYLAAGL